MQVVAKRFVRKGLPVERRGQNEFKSQADAAHVAKDFFGIRNVATFVKLIFLDEVAPHRGNAFVKISFCV